jgi:gamma-glutamyltranspeptidase/glutathione hydrolase
MDFALPYPSSRQPTLGRSAVATSQLLATQAGRNMLQSGGNALDAEVAAAIALSVVEPVSNGIGSELFAIVWDGSALHGLNASERSPAALPVAAVDASHRVGLLHSARSRFWLSRTV